MKRLRTNLGGAVLFSLLFPSAVRANPSLVEIVKDNPETVALAQSELQSELQNEFQGELSGDTQSGLQTKTDTAQIEQLQQRCIQAFRAGRYADAERLVRRLLELTPNDPNAYRVLGSIFGAQGRYAEAEEPLRQALALNPDDAIASALLIAAVGHQGQYVEAETIARAALERHPNHGELHRLLGTTLLEQQGQEAAAETALRQAIELSSEQRLQQSGGAALGSSALY